MFLNGIASSGRVATGYTYFTEYYPQKYQTVIGTIWNVIEGITIILLTIYFVYITKSWLPIMYWAVISNIVALVISLFFLPESPKWLFTKLRYIECYKVLSKMAKFNGRKTHDVIDRLMG